MGNPVFHFKQFSIYQNEKVLKVSTDACIQGAYTAQHCNYNHVLDIGTGTGLLSLMLVQHNKNAEITAVDIHDEAIAIAKQNILQCTLKPNITLLQKDILQFSSSLLYDLIICNPPFFENDLQSKNLCKNLAKHQTHLSIEKLLEISFNLISVDGTFSLLLPYHRLATIINLIHESKLYVATQLLIKHSPTHQYNRVVLLLGKKKPQTINVQEVIIYDSNNQYSLAFRQLMKEYYIIF